MLIVCSFLFAFNFIIYSFLLALIDMHWAVFSSILCTNSLLCINKIPFVIVTYVHKSFEFQHANMRVRSLIVSSHSVDFWKRFVHCRLFSFIRTILVRFLARQKHLHLASLKEETRSFQGAR